MTGQEAQCFRGNFSPWNQAILLHPHFSITLNHRVLQSSVCLNESPRGTETFQSSDGIVPRYFKAGLKQNSEVIIFTDSPDVCTVFTQNDEERPGGEPFWGVQWCLVTTTVSLPSGLVLRSSVCLVCILEVRLCLWVSLWRCLTWQWCGPPFPDLSKSPGETERPVLALLPCAICHGPSCPGQEPQWKEEAGKTSCVLS
jgi:hypothetical protein